MKILVAPDSFKNCLSAQLVGEALRSGVMQVRGEWDVRVIPLADGGEGTTDALVYATNGQFRYAEVLDPLMRPVMAKYGILGDGNTAVIEMAAASGIELLAPEERNPWIASSYGTGQLVLDAIDRGCKRIFVGIGGSATNDAGTGMVHAWGVEFKNIDGNTVGKGGGELGDVRWIETENIDSRIENCELIVACDVTNTLTGPHGASIIYSPQKGANKIMAKRLDANLKHFAQRVKEQLGVEIDTIPGAGAAGGLGAGFLAFTKAKLQPGFEIVQQLTQLDKHIQWADLIITGEGKIDQQTSYGKITLGVAQLAKKYNKTVIGIAGTLDEGYRYLFDEGFHGLFSIIDKPMSLDEAIEATPKLLERCAFSIISLVSELI